jgi:hypothetical protein
LEVQTDNLVCPECSSPGPFVKNGHKQLSDGSDKQRFNCKACNLRFTIGHNDLKSDSDYFSKRQISEILGNSKNLTSTTEIKTVGDTQKEVSIEAQIVRYLVKLKNNGRRDSTVESRDWLIRRLANLGANLNDTEDVKKTIANLERTESYKVLLCIAYEGFLEANGKTWQRPGYKQSESLPFVPHESELDTLIAGCNKKTSTFLKLLKETAMRSGEAWQA